MSTDLLKNLDALNVDDLLNILDGSGSIIERGALKCLIARGESVPQYLYKSFHLSKKAKVRAQCIFYSFSYAQMGDQYAVSLGIAGLVDRAKTVRYNACKLLAYAKDKSTLNHLEKAKSNEKDSIILSDIVASMDAIREGNHNWFVDRNRSGLITMEVTDR